MTLMFVNYKIIKIVSFNKMGIFKYSIIILPLLFYSGCNVSEPSDFLEIDIDINYADLTMDVKLSEFSDHVQYIALESLESSMIGGNKSIDVTDNYIIVRDGDNCFVFDKQNGSYIRKSV